MIGADQVQAAYAAHRRARLGQTGLIVVAMVVATLISANLGEVDLARLWDRSDRLGNYFGRMVPDLAWETLVDDLANWYRRGGRWLRELGVTFLIAIYATLFGMVLAVLGAFVAARPLAPAPWACWVMRRVFEFARTVPELVFAVLFVFSFGIGPLAGVLAIALHTMGALGKLFSEVAENADPDPIRGIRATGATWPQVMRYGALPQVAPAFLSYGLLRFEINVRAASVLGFVGAGGIGQELYTAIKSFAYTDISAIAIMLIVSVALIDMVSETLRHRLIGAASLRAAA
ncbi:phosphonate ABC transporter, permease protein PhnE [Lacimonas salitolerans]|uniref:Phosphonate ABC transporter, permease protein PhnE n=1 Tax=Lacimonas salitolerans TaxID=1323750 RepID=A0ABW4EBM3_9RHOB